MKRDWDLVRAILLHIESVEPGPAIMVKDFALLTSHAQPVIVEHLQIIREASLIVAETLGDIRHPFDVMTFRLTWEGHDLLQKMANDSVWNKTKETAKAAGVALSIGLIKQLADQYMGGLLHHVTATLP